MVLTIHDQFTIMIGFTVHHWWGPIGTSRCMCTLGHKIEKRTKQYYSAVIYRLFQVFCIGVDFNLAIVENGQTVAGLSFAGHNGDMWIQA